MKVELWTDGSGTTSGPIGWAYVLRAVDDDGVLQAERTGCGGRCEGTSQRAELTALLEGLRAIKSPAVVRVFTDSEYVSKAFTDGRLATWQERGWRKQGGGKLVKNRDLWEAIAAEAERHVIEAEWVAGHSGVDLNERCDRLAGAVRAALIGELADVTEVAA